MTATVIGLDAGCVIDHIDYETEGQVVIFYRKFEITPPPPITPPPVGYPKQMKTVATTNIRNAPNALNISILGQLYPNSEVTVTDVYGDYFVVSGYIHHTMLKDEM